jgi:7,8-dihydropterin-6-yl-methyl-4-(beta-D-ribofuranosyl)aminobenzene 5'-phosphate synthase
MAHQLPTADRIEVTVLVDNVTDMFTPPATAVDRRLPLSLTRTLLAEHGLSCLIRIFSEGKVHEVLMDAGLSDICLLHNARELDCDLTGIDAVVLSHGHPDHTGSLCAFFRSTGRTIPLVLHPDAFLQRRLNMPDGPVNLPQLDAAALKDAGAAIQAREHASTLAAGHLLLTGQVPRTTAFERGMPGAEAYINNEWVADPIRDDQGLVIHVKDKGLVVISGCAHAGIINTVEYARQLTGIDRVHAVLGGFHLSGTVFGPIVGPTIDAMQRINPGYVVPMHCTGWSAINRFMGAMPGRCIQNTVGTTYVF